jgi:transcriptional repressor NrdR
MKCPKCKKTENKVIDSRLIPDGNAIRRRRECSACNYRFTTYEYIEKTDLQVVKTDGSSEEYNREKLKNGILIACRKRPISFETIEKMVDDIYNQISEKYSGSVPSSAIGERVMEQLKEADEVAYIRFASVYRKFRDVKEFMNELEHFIYAPNSTLKPE